MGLRPPHALRVPAPQLLFIAIGALFVAWHAVTNVGGDALDAFFQVGSATRFRWAAH
jgi:hypothetical protein